MKKLFTSNPAMSILGGVTGALLTGLLFLSLHTVLASPTSQPPDGSPDFPLAGADGSIGPAGPQGPSGSNGSTGATGPQGPAGPSGSVAASQTFSLGGSSVWRCSARSVLNECGDGDGCRIRIVIDWFTTGDDQMRIIDEHIGVEQYGRNAGNGLYGYTRQSAGGEHAWISGGGWNGVVFTPWDAAQAWTYRPGHCGSYQALSNLTLMFTAAPNIHATFYVYD